MGELVAMVIGLGLGTALGAAAVGLAMLRRRGAEQTEGANLRARVGMLEHQAQADAAALREARQQAAEAHRVREEAQCRLAALTEQLSLRERQFGEQQELLANARTELADAFAALGSRALAANNAQFIELATKTFEKLMTEARGDVEKKQQAIDAVVSPIRELLERHHVAVNELEKKREVAYKGLEQHIQLIVDSHEKLGAQTGKLIDALRRPEQRGRWGEMQLRNVVELAGMTEHCDFREQVQTDDPTTRDRPDMVVNMPGGAVIVVDSKVALDAYLDALDPAADVAERKRAHAKQVQDHVTRLAAKKYWDQFERTPRLVVMFMPLEAALTAALEVMPHLHARAMQQDVLIATPTLLVALLRAVAYGWQQDAAAANAKQITDVARELYARMRTFVEHFEKVGDSLGRASGAYNSAVGSLERNLLTSTRRLRALNATADSEIDGPAPVQVEVRPFTSPELKSLGEGD